MQLKAVLSSALERAHFAFVLVLVSASESASQNLSAPMSASTQPVLVLSSVLVLTDCACAQRQCSHSKSVLALKYCACAQG